MTPSISYRRSTIRESHEYVLSYCPRHYKDVWTEGIPEELNLDIDQIVALENADLFVSIIAEREGQMIGVISGTVYPHALHKGMVFGTTCLLHARNELGRERISIVQGLVSAYEEELKRKYNAKYLQIVYSTGKDISKILERLGYKATDVVMTKQLK